MSCCPLVRLYNVLIARLTARPSPAQVFQRPTRRATARSLKLFAQLPEETLKLIFDQLSRDDLCSLTLTCHAMEDYLGPLYSHWRRCTKLEKQRFLITYARSTPDHLPCFSCLRLHRTKSMLTPGVVVKNTRTRSISHGPSLFLVQSYPKYHFDFLSLQIAMQAYRRDKATRVIDNLSARFFADHTHDRLYPRKELVSIDAVVIKDSLYMRIQRWIYVVATESMATCMASARQPWSDNYPKPRTCMHQYVHSPFLTWRAVPTYNRPHFLSDKSGSRPTEWIKTCKTCGISTQELYLLAGWAGGQAYVSTIWANLGSGTLLDSTNQIWQPSGASGGTVYTQRGNKVHGVKGIVSCEEIYKARAGVSWRDLTRRNHDLSTDRLYMTSGTSTVS